MSFGLCHLPRAFPSPQREEQRQPCTHPPDSGMPARTELHASGDGTGRDGVHYLYSRSCRISTGSRPCGFWMGLIRLCFCCSCRMGEGCPGAGCGTEGPGTAAAGGWAAAGGAGEGRPLGAGTGSFCGVLWPLSSGPGPARREPCEQLGRVIDLRPHRACPLSPWGPGMVTRKKGG